ncbi:MAG TPA: hypothetical protein VGR08_11000, partial [Thermomicrobiales bacterium]|nr:hypothetical protein [Thermomicrobiales bacterium]
DLDAPISEHGLAAIDAIIASNMVNFARMTDATPEGPLSIGFAASSVTHTLTWTGSVWSGDSAEGIPQARSRVAPLPVRMRSPARRCGCR